MFLNALALKRGLWKSYVLEVSRLAQEGLWKSYVLEVCPLAQNGLWKSYVLAEELMGSCVV